MPAYLCLVQGLLAHTSYFSTMNVEAWHDKGMAPVIAAVREPPPPNAMTRFTEPPLLSDGATPVQKMAHHLKTVAGRKRNALRKQAVEPVFGIIKSVMGFRQFSMRGLMGCCPEHMAPRLPVMKFEAYGRIASAVSKTPRKGAPSA